MNVPELLSVPSPFLVEFGQLRLLEPLDTPVNTLCQRLLDGSYEKPFIVDDGQLRYLCLGSSTYIQSVMRIDRPDSLDLRYTQKMMGFLLFKRNPKNIVMLGLGGGSLAKFCYRELPNVDITVVEIDPYVIALRKYFAIPEDDSRFHVLQADAADFVAHANQSVDVLLVDAFDAIGLAHSLKGREFLLQAYAALGPSGILVMNFAGATSHYADLIEDAHEVFEHQTILVSVRDDGNHVLFAFRERLFEPNWRWLKEWAKELKSHYGLDFPSFLQMMKHATQDDIVKQANATITRQRK